MGGREARVDDYVRRAIEGNDNASELLAALFADTLVGPYIDVLSSGKGGMAVLRPDPGDDGVGFVVSGDHTLHGRDLGMSGVSRAVDTAQRLGAEPIGIANVIDSHDADWARIGPVGRGIHDVVKAYRIPVVNGETAILGNRVRDVNLTIVAIATVPKDKALVDVGIPYIRFSHDGKPITINADGVGTKTQLYERMRRYAKALYDFAAMNLDDMIKFGGIAKGLFGLVERNGAIPNMDAEALRLSEQLGVPISLAYTDVGGNIRSFVEEHPAYNLSGAVISTVDEAVLAHPPRPHAGQHLVGLRDPNNPNPRSNGISKLRELAWRLHGHAPTDHWHLNPRAHATADFLSSPSTVFHPFFNDMLQSGVATAVYHMSGGAFDGKLARPLAQLGLYAEIDNLFRPDWPMLPLIASGHIIMQDAHRMWHMGTEGMVSTDSPEAAIRRADDFGLEGRVIGHIREASGKGGVSLTAFNGERVEYLYDAA